MLCISKFSIVLVMYLIYASPAWLDHYHLHCIIASSIQYKSPTSKTVNACHMYGVGAIIGTPTCIFVMGHACTCMYILYTRM